MIVHAGTPTSWSRAVPPFFMAQFCHIRCCFMEQSPREAAADTCLWGGGRGTANRQTQTSDYTEANGGQNGMDRPFSLWFHTEPACGKAPLRGRVNERSSRPPPNSPLSYPAVNRYSSSSLSSQASAEVSNITGQSESSDEVFNMQVPPGFWSGRVRASTGGQPPRAGTRLEDKP